MKHLAVRALASAGVGGERKIGLPGVAALLDSGMRVCRVHVCPPTVGVGRGVVSNLAECLATDKPDHLRCVADAGRVHVCPQAVGVWRDAVSDLAECLATDKCDHLRRVADAGSVLLRRCGGRIETLVTAVGSIFSPLMRIRSV